MKCECGNIITDERDEENSRIARETNTPKLDMCAPCWDSYCHHAITGE